ncbi:hypothetical protein E2P81_ATG00996 [Venturia nashicola]|uniref:CFEM domain-containing protein n=1 Tax=Venturia nashicola TaxID=86259 RepID=A0A4Z1PKJ5_9PEZI|nr:hypothetical protein E6O75_ATG01019 [Venturia nashicola]TLD38453.1 hypothetical protein E2P81_ATG00996 [Venturia nashicola]
MQFTLFSILSLVALTAAYPQGAAAPAEPPASPPASPPTSPPAGGPGGPGGPAGPGLPSCGLNLVAPAFQKSGCSNSDKKCLCASPDLKQVLTSEAVAACSNPTDKQAYQSFFTSLCG